MLNSFKKYFAFLFKDGFSKSSETPWIGADLSLLSHEAKLAASAILLEVASVDGDFSEVELKELIDLLSQHFQLNQAEIAELLERADAKLHETEDLSPFADLIKQTFSEQQKATLMMVLWQIIFADGRLETKEERFARQIMLRLGISEVSSHRAREEAIKVTSSRYIPPEEPEDE